MFTAAPLRASAASFASTICALAPALRDAKVDATNFVEPRCGVTRVPLSGYPLRMRTGALAMIDTLGFKGIWHRASPEEVLSKLHQIRKISQDGSQEMHELLCPVLGLNKDHEVRGCCVSDTVVIGVRPRDGRTTESEIATAIAAAGVLVHHVMWFGHIVPPVWTYRGCITTGAFEIEDNFFVGPAVDEVAELADAADGPFVCLSPRADAIFRNAGTPYTYQALVEYRVPMKAGACISTHCVRLDQHAGLASERKRLREKVLGSFPAGSLAVAIKRQHTIDFYDHLEKTDPSPE
ncbi:MAG: hypothetical protein HY898_02220 [Deltaproteobacteria bacterium]|nr:hypothetical protein [Deltaproteobacteria bacterium]